MHPLDWLIIVCYLAALVGIGAYFARRQNSLGQFIKGEHRASWLTVGISLMAALNSGNDYIQTPAIVFAFGMAYVAQALSWIVVYPWVTRVTIPFYRKLDVYSVYEYLERRFGLGVRIAGAVIFLIWRISWMGAALYVPCLAVKGASGGEMDITWLIVAVGATVTFYTMLGGMQAVLWTDVTQFFLMLGGLVLALGLIVSTVPGGVAEIIATTTEAGRLSFFAPSFAPAADGLLEKITAYLTTEVTFIGIIIFCSLSRLAAFTGDQIAVQRFQAARSPSDARNAYIVNAITDAIWMIVLGCVGLALFAYFRHVTYPIHLQNDKVLPYFMAHAFPIGIKGAVLASIFAASLSSVDAALNSATSIVVVDFYNRIWLGRVRPSEAVTLDEAHHQVLVSRVVNVLLGGIVITIAVNIEQLGELYTVINKVFGALFGALFGTFVLGMFSRRANGPGVLSGAIAGLMVSCFFSFFSVATPWHDNFSRLFGEGALDFFSRISWQWPPLAGITTTLTVGYIASRAVGTQRDKSPPLTFAQVLQLPATRGNGAM